MATGETIFDDVTGDPVSVRCHSRETGLDDGHDVRDADLSDVAHLRTARHEFLARLSGARPVAR